MTIAGHTFSAIEGHCACGKRFSDIAFAAYGGEWIGKPGIAHHGDLNVREQTEIATEIERIFGAVKS